MPQVNSVYQSVKNIPLSKVCFYALLFFLPLGTRKIYFTASSYYFGYHAFYNSIYLYLTDLFIFGLILIWALENSKNKGFFHKILTGIKNERIYLIFVIFWLISAISVLVSREIPLGFYGLLKLTETFLFLAYIRENISVSREIKRVFWLILASGALESLMGITQYFKQHSLGLRVFGEEKLVPGIKGIAEFVSHGIINSRLLEVFPQFAPVSYETVNIRAYATFPHPNVFSAFLLLGFFANLYLIYSVSQKHNSPSPPRKLRGGWGVLLNISREIFLSLSLILISAGMVLTFSRATWGVASLSIIILSLWLMKARIIQVGRMRVGRFFPDKEQHYHPRRLALIIFVLLVSLGLNLLFFGPQIKDRLSVSRETTLQPSPLVGEGAPTLGRRGEGFDESIANRKFYNSIALDMIKAHPMLGVGLHNFVKQMDQYSSQKLLPYLHQPVHNIYLLIAAESGIGALIFFLLLLSYIVRNGMNGEKGSQPARLASESVAGGGPKLILLLVFSGFLILGLFDHYFWTIQQGSLMFWTVAGLLTARQNQVSEI